MTSPEAKTSQSDSSDRIPRAVQAGYVVLLAILCAISFYGVVELGFESDDQQNIADAERVLDGEGTLFSTERAFAGRPVVEVVFAVTYALWGRSEDAYHIFAVFLHFCASLLTVRVLTTLGVSRRVSAAAGVLFTVGVPHYQVVHWVSGIAYSIYYSLGVLSIDKLVVYLKDRRLPLLVTSTVLLSLAVFSHAAAVSFLPFGVFVIWYLRFDLRRLILPLIIYTIGAALPFFTILLLYADVMTSHGAERATEWSRVGISWLSYFGNAFLTSHLLLYPAPHHTDSLSAGIGLAAVVFIAGAAMMRWRGLLLGLVYSALMVTPFIATGFERVQPRYLYAASLGVYLLGAWMFAEHTVLGVWESRLTRRIRVAVGAGVVVLSIAQLHTSLGVTHLRDARSLVSIGQPDTAIYHYFRGYEIAGHLCTRGDLVRLTKVALHKGASPNQILEEAVLQRDDFILKALFGAVCADQAD